MQIPMPIPPLNGRSLLSGLIQPPESFGIHVMVGRIGQVYCPVVRLSVYVSYILML